MITRKSLPPTNYCQIMNFRLKNDKSKLRIATLVYILDLNLNLDDIQLYADCRAISQYRRSLPEAYKSVVGIFRGLLETLVVYHSVFDSHQDFPPELSSLSSPEADEVLNVTVVLVHTGNVNFIIEFENGRFLGY